MFDKYGYNPFRSQVTLEVEAIWGEYPKPVPAMGKFIANEGIRYQDPYIIKLHLQKYFNQISVNLKIINHSKCFLLAGI